MTYYIIREGGQNLVLKIYNLREIMSVQSMWDKVYMCS